MLNGSTSVACRAALVRAGAVRQVARRAVLARHRDDLAARLEANGGQLLGPAPTLADIAFFPFVRQFAGTDEGFWASRAPASVQGWLAGHAASPRFAAIMRKFPRWQTGAEEPLLTAR